MGKAIDDNGNAWVAVQSLPDGGETHLTLWRGAQSQTHTLDTKNVKYARSLSDSHFVIWDCLPLFEGDNHCDFSYRLYQVTSNGMLQFHGEWDPFRYPYPNIVFSADASMWGIDFRPKVLGLSRYLARLQRDLAAGRRSSMDPGP